MDRVSKDMRNGVSAFSRWKGAGGSHKLAEGLQQESVRIVGDGSTEVETRTAQPERMDRPSHPTGPTPCAPDWAA